MKTIDLIILGIIHNETLSAYDIQKIVDYRNISRWVKISTPSIYKKVIQLEKKGLISSKMVREGNMAEKAVYSLTAEGKKEFDRLMFGISTQPIYLFIDFNAVIVNLDNLAIANQKICLANIEKNIKIMKDNLQENIALKKDLQNIPDTGKAVLKQQLLLAEAIEEWIDEVKQKHFE